MGSNPLIQRYSYSILRPRQVWIYATIYIAIVLLMVLINYSHYQYISFEMTLSEFFKSLYVQFVAFQTLILIIWGAYNSSSAIKEEVLNKSYDFFRMLPLAAHKKTLGIVIGKNLLVLLFAIINQIFLIIFGMAGRVNINLQSQIFILLISITMISSLGCLLFSINPARKNKGSPIVMVLVIIFFIIPTTINAIIAASSVKELESSLVSFYTLKVPVLLLISFIALYFGGWCFKGIVRRFTAEQEPLFTRNGGVLFLVGYILIAVGIYSNIIQNLSPQMVYSYWLATLPPLIFIPLFSLRNIEGYVEYSSVHYHRKPKGFDFLRQSNVLYSLLLFAIWAVFAAGTTIHIGLLSNVYNILVLLTAYLFILLLLELYVVYSPVSNKIGLLLGFIAGLYLFLPLILSGVFQSEVIYLYSPMGFMGSVIDKCDIDTSVRTTSGIFNIMLCIIPVMLIVERYKKLAK